MFNTFLTVFSKNISVSSKTSFSKIFSNLRLHSVEGLELEEFDDLLPLDSADIEDMLGDYGASFYEDYARNAYKSVIAQFIVVNTHEVIITLPIPVSAQDPMSFDIRKAIMESKLFQELMKWSDIQEIINLWYKIRRVFKSILVTK